MPSSDQPLPGGGIWHTRSRRGMSGLPTLASPIGSHREIQAMYDFQEHVLLCSTLHTSDWASAMRLVSCGRTSSAKT